MSFKGEFLICKKCGEQLEHNLRTGEVEICDCEKGLRMKEQCYICKAHLVDSVPFRLETQDTIYILCSLLCLHKLTYELEAAAAYKEASQWYDR